MLGDFHDDVLNIECETNSADIWVVDAEGVYIDNIGLHSYLENDVVDAINAKYGTNFNTLTMQKVTSIAIGDDCPDWDAYEKIELDILNVKFSGGVFGQKIGDTLYMATSNGSNQIIVDWQGGFVGTLTGPLLSEDRKTYYLNYMRVTGHEVTEVISETLSLSVGDEIEGWNEYVQIDS